ncbi:SCO family protein [Azospirillum sp. SYSU D00513]|uniref:SCO family protein n=1 Tax=Azospirillum sp. SYSU D00513 TaxID=2812561 RepID=UPI001A95EEFC|nr:SCO family protein [Azospirillum sp. SYSU D00513]
MKARILRIAVAMAIGLVIAAGIAWWQVQNEPQPSRTARTQETQTAVSIGGPFTLTDHTGKTVTDQDYQGQYRLIYFGYSYCPDVCPTELGSMARAMEVLGPLGDRVQPLMITIDPERDTVSHLAEYVALFHPRMVGLTGTPEQVAAVTKAYRVYAAKRPAEGGKTEEYLMDHSGFLYLMGPDGAFIRIFPAGTTGDELAADLRARLAG